MLLRMTLDYSTPLSRHNARPGVFSPASIPSNSLGRFAIYDGHQLRDADGKPTGLIALPYGKPRYRRTGMDLWFATLDHIDNEQLRHRLRSTYGAVSLEYVGHTIGRCDWITYGRVTGAALVTDPARRDITLSVEDDPAAPLDPKDPRTTALRHYLAAHTRTTALRHSGLLPPDRR